MQKYDTTNSTNSSVFTSTMLWLCIPGRSHSMVQHNKELRTVSTTSIQLYKYIKQQSLDYISINNYTYYICTYVCTVVAVVLMRHYTRL